MNSFMSWVGGKKALREEVVRRFPLFYERYIEVFGGGGWVLFHKPPGNDFEVYNDFNSLLTNLYRCVREKPDLLMNALRYVLNSREDFDRARLALRRRRTTDIQRAAWFYQIIRKTINFEFEKACRDCTHSTCTVDLFTDIWYFLLGKR